MHLIWNRGYIFHIFYQPEINIKSKMLETCKKLFVTVHIKNIPPRRLMLIKVVKSKNFQGEFPFNCRMSTILEYSRNLKPNLL